MSNWKRIFKEMYRGFEPDSEQYKMLVERCNELVAKACKSRMSDAEKAEFGVLTDVIKRYEGVEYDDD